MRSASMRPIRFATNVQSERRKVKGEPPTPLPGIDDARVRCVGPDDDLVAIFRERAQGVGLHVVESSPDNLARSVAERVRELSHNPADRPRVVIEPALRARESIETALGELAELLDPAAGDEAVFAADVGITGVCAAIAETGSIVCASGAQRWRGLSLIPPAHIAILREDQIVPDLVDFFAGRVGSGLPAHLALISGPSKTADIEGILITGVHGPGRVCVVLVRASA